MSLASFKKIIALLSLSACTSLFAAPLVVDVTGIQSLASFGSSGNTVLTFNVGANSTLTTLDYSVNLTAFSPSYLSEIRLALTRSDLSGGFALVPGFANPAAGTGTFTNSLDLVAIGRAFDVGADGILRLEFYEGFNDALAVDGIWNFGTVTLGIVPEPSAVPEPATALLMGMGVMMVCFGRRRARQSRNSAAV